MTPESGKRKTAPLTAVPAKETHWEITQNHWKRLERLEEYLGIESEESTLPETLQGVSCYVRYIERYIAGTIRKEIVRPFVVAMLRDVGMLPLMVEPETVSPAPKGISKTARRLPLPNRSAANDALLRHLLERHSVVSEYGVESPSERIGSELENLRGAAESLVRDFDALLARINRHTDLCLASRELRETVRANRDTPLYWALVDLDDCIRACRPEDMSQEMAETLPRCVSQLAVGMSEEQMLRITDALYGAGFRPWKPPKRKARRGKKTAPR